jgi:hypothetical protein
MRTLFDTLDQLDRASITAQRKLTIPFVKDILKLCRVAAAPTGLHMAPVGPVSAAPPGETRGSHVFRRATNARLAVRHHNRALNQLWIINHRLISAPRRDGRHPG